MQKKPAFNTSKPHLNAQGLQQESPLLLRGTIWGAGTHSFHLGQIRVSDVQWHA